MYTYNKYSFFTKCVEFFEVVFSQSKFYSKYAQVFVSNHIGQCLYQSFLITYSMFKYMVSCTIQRLLWLFNQTSWWLSNLKCLEPNKKPLSLYCNERKAISQDDGVNLFWWLTQELLSSESGQAVFIWPVVGVQMVSTRRMPHDVAQPPSLQWHGWGSPLPCLPNVCKHVW